MQNFFRTSISGFLFALASCGGAAHPKIDHDPVLEQAIGGWVWVNVTDKDNVRHVEAENWRFARKDGEVKGIYERRATFIALDGVPFRCNQRLSYTLSSMYEVETANEEGELVLRESRFHASPDPCDRERRLLTEYRAKRQGNQLVLAYDGGEQTLEFVAPANAENSPPGPPKELTGRWSWTFEESLPGGQRSIETEAWQLDEKKGGDLTGTYDRTVTLFARAGEVLSCNNQAFYEYRDRYKLRGHRDGDKVEIAEIEVEKATHPCLPHKERHLDSARGEIAGSFMVLTWRGRYRQVLERAGIQN